MRISKQAIHTLLLLCLSMVVSLLVSLLCRKAKIYRVYNLPVSNNNPGQTGAEAAEK